MHTHELLDGCDLVNVFSDPPTPTVGPLITWREFWRLYAEAEAYGQGEAAAWNDDVRVFPVTVGQA